MHTKTPATADRQRPSLWCEVRPCTARTAHDRISSCLMLTPCTSSGLHARSRCEMLTLESTSYSALRDVPSRIHSATARRRPLGAGATALRLAAAGAGAPDKTARLGARRRCARCAHESSPRRPQHAQRLRRRARARESQEACLTRGPGRRRGRRRGRRGRGRGGRVHRVAARCGSGPTARPCRRTVSTREGEAAHVDWVALAVEKLGARGQRAPARAASWSQTFVFPNQ